jgi:hypothetical protein
MAFLQEQIDKLTSELSSSAPPVAEQQSVGSESYECVLRRFGDLFTSCRV